MTIQEKIDRIITICAEFEVCGTDSIHTIRDIIDNIIPIKAHIKNLECALKLSGITINAYRKDNEKQNEAIEIYKKVAHLFIKEERIKRAMGFTPKNATKLYDAEKEMLEWEKANG